MKIALQDKKSGMIFKAWPKEIRHTDMINRLFANGIRDIIQGYIRPDGSFITADDYMKLLCQQEEEENEQKTVQEDE